MFCCNSRHYLTFDMSLTSSKKYLRDENKKSFTLIARLIWIFALHVMREMFPANSFPVDYLIDAADWYVSVKGCSLREQVVSASSLIVITFSRRPLIYLRWKSPLIFSKLFCWSFLFFCSSRGTHLYYNPHTVGRNG